MSCIVCERINLINEGKNPHFIMELSTGYVVIGDYQLFKGYTLFICKYHFIELHDLPNDIKLKHLEEMSMVAEAVFNAFKPSKLNYELLGNPETHIHWHIFPRFDGDTPQKGPVWWVGNEKMYDEINKPDDKELSGLVSKVKKELELLLNKQ